MGGWNETKRNTRWASLVNGNSTAGGWFNLASWWLRMILRMVNFGFGVSLGLVGFPVGWVWDTETSKRWRWDVDGVQCELFRFFVVVAGGTWCCFFGPTIFAKDLICPTSRGQRQAVYSPPSHIYQSNVRTGLLKSTRNAMKGAIEWCIPSYLEVCLEGRIKSHGKVKYLQDSCGDYCWKWHENPGKHDIARHCKAAQTGKSTCPCSTLSVNRRYKRRHHREESWIARVDRWFNLMIDMVSTTAFVWILTSCWSVFWLCNCCILDQKSINSTFKSIQIHTVSALWMLTLQRGTIYTLQKLRWTLQTW